MPLYVALDGNSLGTVDYRVNVPADDTTGDRRVYWSLQSHQINATWLLVDEAAASEEFQEWLNVQSRFHDYSHRNSLLIKL